VIAFIGLWFPSFFLFTINVAIWRHKEKRWYDFVDDSPVCVCCIYIFCFVGLCKLFYFVLDGHKLYTHNVPACGCIQLKHENAVFETTIQDAIYNTTRVSRCIFFSWRLYGRRTTHRTMEILFVASILNDLRDGRVDGYWCHYQKTRWIYQYQGSSICVICVLLKAFSYRLLS
jgi:hypothetical protein